MKTALKKEERENTYKGIALPDNVKEQTVRSKEGIGRAIEEYEKSIGMKREKIILTPNDINRFINSLPEHHNYDFFNGSSKFLNFLIQDSYEAGFNDFLIDTRLIDKKIEYVCNVLDGRADDPLKITIRASKTNIGYYSRNCIYHIIGEENIIGQEAEHSKFIIEGENERIGFHSNECDFNIDGNVKKCGEQSKRSRYHINGNVDDVGNSAKLCDFIIEGSVEKNCGIDCKQSTFHVKRDVDNLGPHSYMSEFIVDRYTKTAGNLSKESFFDLKGNVSEIKKGGNCIFLTSKNIVRTIGDPGNNSIYNSIIMIKGTLEDNIKIKARNSFFLTDNPNTYQKLRKKVEKTNTIMLINNEDNPLRYEERKTLNWNNLK